MTQEEKEKYLFALKPNNKPQAKEKSMKITVKKKIHAEIKD
jgi:hypothetical protein